MEIFLAIISILLSIVSFFLVRTLGKFDELEKSFHSIEIKLAEVVVKLEGYNSKTIELESRVTSVEKEMDKMRDKHHNILNEINKLSLKCQLQHGEN